MEGSSLRLSQANWKDDYTLVVTVLCVVAGCLWYSFRKSRLNRPPGPWRWPVVGNLPQLMLSMKKYELPHIAMQDLANRYGPIMTLQLGSLSCIVVSSGEWTKKIMRDYDQQFANKGNMIMGEILYRNYKSIGLCHYTARTILLKKICTEELLSANRIKAAHDLRTEVMTSMLQRVLAESEGGKRPVYVEKAMIDLKFTYMSNLLFRSSYLGLKIRSGNKEYTLADVVRESTSLGNLSIGEFFPSLRIFDIGGVEASYLRLRNSFDQFLNPIIAQHRQKRAEGETDEKSRDFVDALLEHEEISDDEIKNVIQDMMLGGIDTGAITLNWIMTELMRHPDVKRRLHTELDDVVGRDRRVEEDDLVNLPFLQAVIKESFRLHPPVAMTFRESDSNAVSKIEGYDVPKRTRILINLYSIAHEPSVWKDPFKFIPERFLENDVDIKGFSFDLLPFGAGRRKCPGINSGLLIVTLAMANLLHCCEFSLPEGVSPEDVDVVEEHGLTLHKRNPLNLLVTQRLQPSVYGLNV